MEYHSIPLTKQHCNPLCSSDNVGIMDRRSLVEVLVLRGLIELIVWLWRGLSKYADSKILSKRYFGLYRVATGRCLRHTISILVWIISYWSLQVRGLIIWGWSCSESLLGKACEFKLWIVALGEMSLEDFFLLPKAFTIDAIRDVPLLMVFLTDEVLNRGSVVVLR